MIRKITRLFRGYLPTVLMAERSRRSEAEYEKAVFPKQLATLLLTNRCNLRCIMCGQWNSVAKEGELTVNEWKLVFTQLKEAGFKDIHLTGGEPLIRKDILEIIREAVAAGLTVGMTTNGMLLTAEMATALLKAGLTSVAVSVDGVGASYEEIRGVKGGYEKVLRALEIVSRYKRESGLIAYINFTLMKASLANFRDLKKVADALGLPVAICLLDDTPYFFNVKENRERFWIDGEQRKDLENLVEFLAEEKRRLPGSLILTPSALSYIATYFTDTVQKKIPCIVSQTRLFVDPYGNALGGCLSMGVIGNVKESSVREILLSGKSKELHKKMFYKKCPGCSCGYLYNIQHHLPSLVSDLLKGWR